jgi:hypothetical protein
MHQDIEEIKGEGGRVDGDGGKSKEEQDKKGEKWKGTRKQNYCFSFGYILLHVVWFCLPKIPLRVHNT